MNDNNINTAEQKTRKHVLTNTIKAVVVIFMIAPIVYSVLGTDEQAGQMIVATIVTIPVGVVLLKMISRIQRKSK